MMIRLSKSDHYSLKLEVDEEGCGLMLQAYQDALQHHSTHLPITLDKRVFTRHLGFIEAELVIVQNEEAGKLVVDSNLVTLYLDDDDLAYGIDRLSEGFFSHVIFPAELCDVLVKGASITIYCLLLNTGTSSPSV